MGADEEGTHERLKGRASYPVTPSPVYLCGLADVRDCRQEPLADPAVIVEKAIQVRLDRGIGALGPRLY